VTEINPSIELTRLQPTREALRDVQLPGIVWVGDAEGRRTFFNQHWVEFTGRSESQQVGHGWLKGLAASDQRRYLAELRSAAQTQRSLRTTYRLMRSDGRSRLVLEEAQPHFGHDGRLTGFTGVCMDIEDVRRSARSRDETAALRTLSGRLERAREEERSRLARELHDELGQVLTSTKLDLMWLCDRVRQPGARPSLSLVNKLQSLAGLVELAIAAVQRITTELKPAVLDHLGLEAALEWEATKFHARTGIRCRVESRPAHFELDPLCATVLFRIAQESLTNVARHAHAGAVRLALRKQKNRVVLEVQDNGRGISERELKNPRSTGLLGMRERARLLGGELRILATPGRGTRVVVSIPGRESV
jgi:PAS domain S-box-containing protein